jgi:hypothetical protein
MDSWYKEGYDVDEGDIYLEEQKSKLIINHKKIGTMKKSKVKNIQSVKEWAGGNGTVYYHNLEMENGDKINIGKKKQLAVGDELDYEITEQDGTSEYPKAKTPKMDNYSGGQGAGKKDDYVKGIEVGHAINNAVNMMCAGVDLNIKECASNEEKIYESAKVIMAISARLKSE